MPAARVIDPGRVGNVAGDEVRRSRQHDLILLPMRDEHRDLQAPEHVPVIELAVEHPLANVGRHRRIEPEKEIEVVGIELAMRQQVHEAPEGEAALSGIVREKRGRQSQQGGPEHPGGFIGPQLRRRVNEVETADGLLPVVAHIVAHDIAAVGPSAQHRSLQAQRPDHRVDVVGPVLAVLVRRRLAWLVRQAVAADVKPGEVEVGRQRALELPVPRDPALAEPVNEQDRGVRGVANCLNEQLGTSTALDETSVKSGIWLHRKSPLGMTWGAVALKAAMTGAPSLSPSSSTERWVMSATRGKPQSMTART